MGTYEWYTYTVFIAIGFFLNIFTTFLAIASMLKLVMVATITYTYNMGITQPCVYILITCGAQV